MSVRCGYVGLVGLPNVGKSSFLNNVLSENLSIVSEKPQTTRRAFTGIYSRDNSQIVFLDSPGFVSEKPGLWSFLASEMKTTLNDADLLLVVIANDQKDSPLWRDFWQVISQSKKKVAFLLSKADLPRSSFMENFLQDPAVKDSPLLPINNLKFDQQAVESFLGEMSQGFPLQDHYFFDPDQLSPWNLRDLAAEWVREACFIELSQEIPFGLAVRIDSFKEEEKITRIEATIMVEKDNHKAIVIGKGGSMMKKIGQQAREKMEKILEQKVYLGLHVSVKKGWQKNHRMMKELGYDGKKS